MKLPLRNHQVELCELLEAPAPPLPLLIRGYITFAFCSGVFVDIHTFPYKSLLIAARSILPAEKGVRIEEPFREKLVRPTPWKKILTSQFFH